MISWIAAELKGTWSCSSRLFSTPSIQSSISSKPSCTLKDRVRVIWSFSFLSFTDLDKLSYLSTISSDKEKSIFSFFPLAKLSFYRFFFNFFYFICSHQVGVSQKLATSEWSKNHQLYSVQTLKPKSKSYSRAKKPIGQRERQSNLKLHSSAFRSWFPCSSSLGHLLSVLKKQKARY